MNNDELRTLAAKVLEDGYLMSLGTVDESGVWVADVIYVHDDDFNLYWISLPQTRHSKALGQNSQVACAITANQEVGKERALQVTGIAEKVDGPLFELEKKHRTKRGMEPPTRPGEILEDNHSWYVLRPAKIDLLHSEPFGYEHQIIIPQSPPDSESV